MDWKLQTGMDQRNSVTVTILVWTLPLRGKHGKSSLVVNCLAFPLYLNSQCVKIDFTIPQNG